MNKNNNATIAAIVLGVLFLIALIWGITQMTSKNKLKTQTTTLTEEKSELELLRADLEREVDSLTQEFQTLASENEELEGSLSDAQAKLVSAEKALSAAKKSAAGERNSLRAEIQALIDAKATLQSNIDGLMEENQRLKEQMGILEQDLAMTQQEKEALAALNQTINEEVKRLTLANFKASGFQVVIGQKNEKVTSKSKKARSIDVAFDLANVPPEYQGVRPIYLVLTDERGNPIPMSNPVKATSVVNNQTVELLAAESKEVNINENQRLSFSHELDEKLKAGLYRASVYTDIGLLGASSFTLR